MLLLIIILHTIKNKNNCQTPKWSVGDMGHGILASMMVNIAPFEMKSEFYGETMFKMDEIILQCN